MDPATQLFVILLISGTLLLLAELFVPGGVLGALGALALVGAIVLAFSAYGALMGFWVALGVVFFALVFMALWLRFMPSTRLGKSLTLNEDGKDFKAHDDSIATLAGKQGVTLSELRPSGIAMIDGKRLDVMTDGQWVDKNKPVSVIEARGGRIVVGEINS